MKKLVLALLAVVMMGGAAFAASDLKLIVGADLSSKLESTKVDTGFLIGAEWLFPVSDIVKIGPGIQYGFERDVKNVGWGISLLPIYATIEINPIESVKELFFKGSLGFGTVIGEDDSESGLYYGFGAGYNITEELSVGAGYFITSSDPEFKTFQINVGYKFAME